MAACDGAGGQPPTASCSYRTAAGGAKASRPPGATTTTGAAAAATAAAASANAPATWLMAQGNAASARARSVPGAWREDGQGQDGGCTASGSSARAPLIRIPPTRTYVIHTARPLPRTGRAGTRRHGTATAGGRAGPARSPIQQPAVSAQPAGALPPKTKPTKPRFPLRERVGPHKPHLQGRPKGSWDGALGKR